ncbi:MAG: nickel pincer cofactor biosynthesis protein LarC [Deltaproteobacteria bacterium]
MRLAYGDLIGGISGDMFVAALLDLGLPLPLLRSELRKIPSLKFELKASKTIVQSIRATRFQVICRKGRQEPARTWSDIRKLIERSRLASEAKETGGKIFSRLAEAESKIHHVPVDKVHFHEVGATDSIVDIMAAAIGCQYFNIKSFQFSKIPLGRGTVQGAHGPLPIPGPATLELLKDLPVEWTQLEGETVTPTGAAIISSLGTRFGMQTGMTVEKIGYGSGTKEWPDRPNLFRLVLGKDDAGWCGEEMVVMETNIDDMNPELYDYVFDCLFAAGARDVFLAPVQMKKNRPATLLRVIAEPAKREELAKILFRETSTIGIRFYRVGRMILKRSSANVKTRYGTVRVKVTKAPDGTIQSTPEYEDLKRIAAAKKVPLKLLYDEIVTSLKK